MKPSTKRITVYKAFVVEPITKEINRRGGLVIGGIQQDVTKEWVDSQIKQRAGHPYSTKTMTKDELEEVIIAGRLWGDEWGLDLDDPEDELDKDIDLNFDR